MQALQVGLAVHGQQGVGEPGVHTHRVARFHLDAIGVEAAADMGQAVPLRRVLQAHQHDVAVDDVGEFGILAVVRPAEALLARALAIAQHGIAAWRDPAGVHQLPARHVERQAQAERAALANLGDALHHLGGRDQVQAAALVVRTELAPVRARRRWLPALSPGRACAQRCSTASALCAAATPIFT
ncbi:MAG: hypothetical protein JNM33_14165 [Rubrivivax sp.]|nr:hypothetical protein [Rubrivivax sp.]